jgi:hypothetical protein
MREGGLRKKSLRHKMEQMEMVGYLYKTSVWNVRLEKKYRQLNKQLNYNNHVHIHNRDSFLISSQVENLKGCK